MLAFYAGDEWIREVNSGSRDQYFSLHLDTFEIIQNPFTNSLSGGHRSNSRKKGKFVSQNIALKQTVNIFIHKLTCNNTQEYPWNKKIKLLTQEQTGI